MELALVKERAERDKQEREALEGLKMRLEAEKGKVEAELEAERALTVDKDALLERSKKHEAELEEEIAALQSDLDTLDNQLDRALSDFRKRVKRSTRPCDRPSTKLPNISFASRANNRNGPPRRLNSQLISTMLRRISIFSMLKRKNFRRLPRSSRT